jgi:hypothetical protein
MPRVSAVLLAAVAAAADFRVKFEVEVPRRVLEPCANYPAPLYSSLYSPSHALTPRQVLQRVLELCASATAP